jgi:hypothetical protein
MIEVILFHWTTYLFLAWLALIAVVNLWPRKPPGNPLKGARRMRGARKDERELIHHER